MENIITVSLVAKIVTRTWTWVMMMCGPTHTLSLNLSLSFLLYLWPTRWVLLPLVVSLFPSVSFSWYLLIEIEFLDISWFKTIFFLIFGKVYIYSNTHPLTWSQTYTPTLRCHMNTPFLRVRYQAKKSWKITQTRSPTRYDVVPTLKKKISCCTASSGSARLRHSSDCSKPVHNHFLKKPVLNTFTTCPCQYGSIEPNVLKRRMIVVIKKDSKCLSLHRLEQHRRIWLSKKTYRTLVQPADPCGNPFGAFWRNDMKNTQPHLKAGLGISRTHAHSQRNSSIFWLWIRTDFFQ